MIAHVEISAAPPSKLLPNNRRKSHWGAEAKATAIAREQAGYDMLRFPRPAEPYPGPVHIVLFARYPRRRKLPDSDGTLGAAKPYIDALADVGVIVDDKQVAVTTIYHEWSDLAKSVDPYPDGFTRIMVLPFTGFPCTIDVEGVG